MLKRGTVMMHGEEKCVVLGPEDFEGYDYNNPTRITPSKPWEFVRLESGVEGWVPRSSLHPVSLATNPSD